MWIVRKCMYKKTLIFNYFITNIEMWCWWKVRSVNPSLGYMVRLVLRLISWEHILACNTARWKKETPICKLCDVYTTESVWHFLFDCINVNLGVVREEMLKTIYDVMPTPIISVTDYFTTLRGMHDNHGDHFQIRSQSANAPFYPPPVGERGF